MSTFQNKTIEEQKQQLEKDQVELLEEKLEKIKDEIVQPEKPYQGKKKTQEEYEKEKQQIIEQIKELEEDYYHPTEKMPDEEVEKIEEDLKNHPLFMKEIPKDITQNKHLEALSQIIYDDTPENIAKHCQEKGNELYKKGPDQKYYLNEAYKQYTEGIEAKGADPIVNSKLYNNRALINIKKKNYGRAAEDCQLALKEDPQFVKALFRLAQVYGFQSKHKEAIDTLFRAQTLDPKNKEISILLRQNQEKYNKELLKAQEKKTVKKTGETVLFNSLKLRNIYLGQPIMDFPDGVNKSCWLDEESKLHFPTFVQYPEFQQMDYIQDVPEDHIFADQIKQLIGTEGIPYDVKKLYNMQNIELYIELNQVEPYYEIKNPQKWPKQRGLVKIDMNKKITSILSIKGYVLPRVAEFYMVSPDSKEFYYHFTRNFQILSQEDLKL